VFLTPERLDKAEEFFDRQGAKIITIARFIEGLRQANGIIAGITKMHWLRFIAYNALGAALWVGTWVSIGYFAGQHINTIYGVITRYSLYVAIAAVVVIVALIARHIMRKRRQAVRPAARSVGGGSRGGSRGGSFGGSRGGEAARDGEAVGGGSGDGNAAGGGSGDGEAAGGGSGDGKAAGGGSGDVEAADAQGAEAAAATDAVDGRSDEALAEAGDPGEAGRTGANARSGLSAESNDAAPTNAAHVDADHADDADDGAESGSSDKELMVEASESPSGWRAARFLLLSPWGVRSACQFRDRLRMAAVSYAIVALGRALSDGARVNMCRWGRRRAEGLVGVRVVRPTIHVRHSRVASIYQF
jgi:hypothetical protein